MVSLAILEWISTDTITLGGYWAQTQLKTPAMGFMAHEHFGSGINTTFVWGIAGEAVMRG